MNGKYRVSGISEDVAAYDFLKQAQDRQFANGVYLFVGSPRRIALMHTDAELRDFFFANGGLTAKKFEMLSYYSDDKLDGDGTAFLRRLAFFRQVKPRGAEIGAAGKMFFECSGPSERLCETPEA